MCVYRDKYGVEFQLVDMRWGVRDEMTNEHMTTGREFTTRPACLSLR